MSFSLPDRPASVLAMLLLALASVLVAAGGVADDPGQGSTGNPHDEDEDETEEEDEEEDEDEAGDEDEEDDEDENETEEAEESSRGPSRRPGHFQVSESNDVESNDVDGRFVDFTIDAAACKVMDYRVAGVLIFDEIRLSGECDVEDGADDEDHDDGDHHGARMDLESDEAEFRIHDAPNGLLRFSADENGRIEFDLDDGVEANLTDGDLNLSAGNLTARMFLNGHANLSIDGDMVSVEDAKGNFMVHPDRPGHDLQELRDAVHRGQVGGEVELLVENGTVVPEAQTFDDVMIRPIPREDGSFRFVVDGNLTEGRVFAIHFAPSLFEHGKIGVRFFDVNGTSAESLEVAITESANLSDVLDIQPDEGPEFWIIHDEEGKHILVAVPEFSVHVFEVFSIPPEIQPMILYGLFFGVAFVAVGTIGMFMGRRRQPQ